MAGGRGRGMMRGNPGRPSPYNRGRGGGRGGHFQGPLRNSVFIPFSPFDLEHCAVQFPKVTSNEFDSQVGEMILERNKKIMLAEDDQQAMSKVYEEITEVLGTFYTENDEAKKEEVKTEADAETPAEQEPQAIDDIRTVGAFANETLIDGVKELEILITMRNPMKIDEFGEFSDKLASALATYTITSSEEAASIRVESLTGFRANCFITCSGNKIKTSAEEHLQKRLMYKNFDMGKRAKWFADNCVDPNIRLLARILSDFKVRFNGFLGMSQWAVELLAHYSMSTFDEAGNPSILPVPSALKRSLMLLSSGFFLPGSAGIRDPAERDGRSVHNSFSKLEMDNICCAAQSLLRILMQGGGRKVFGLEDSTGLLEEMQVINDVVVQPSVQCYVHNEETTPDPVAAEGAAPVKMEA